MFSVGDWIKGKSVNGELVLGYIEQINSSNGTVKVKVIEADHDKIVGKSIETLSRSVSILPDISFRNEEDIRYFIDLALMTKDEEWFKELTDKLLSTQNEKKDSDKRIVFRSSQKNRLGSSQFN